MRTFLAPLIVGISALTCSREAGAQESRWTPFYSMAVTGAVSTNGAGLPPALIQNAMLAYRLNDRWVLITKLGYATSFTAFQPAPQVQTGALVVLGDSLSLGASLFYRYVAHWSGTPSDTSVVGGAITLIFPTRARVMIVIPVGASYNTSAQLWSFFTGAELVFPLRF